MVLGVQRAEQNTEETCSGGAGYWMMGSEEKSVLTPYSEGLGKRIMQCDCPGPKRPCAPSLAGQGDSWSWEWSKGQ